MKKIFIKAAFLIPILALLILTVYKAYVLHSGVKFTLPITGYDPRNILSGHYLIYTVDYGAENFCSENADGYMYLNYDTSYGNFFLKEKIEKKDREYIAYIKGVCRNGRFEAGIEKYYIPEAKAVEYDQLIRKGKAKVVISVNDRGEALVKELLFEE